MKKILTLSIILCAVASLWAQDVITLKNGEEIKALVQEIGIDDVKYRKFDNPQGPVYTLLKSEIFMIKYENGNRDVFDVKNTSGSQKEAAQTNTVQANAGNSGSVLGEAIPRPAPATPRADRKITAGFVIGLNSSDIGGLNNWMESLEAETSRRFGFNVGFVMDFKLTKFLSLQPVLQYTLKGKNFAFYTDLISVENGGQIMVEDAWDEASFSLGYVELPVYLLAKIKTGKAGFVTAGAAPYIAYGLHGSWNNDYYKNNQRIIDHLEDYNANIIDLKVPVFKGEDKIFDRLDYGLNFLAGYEWAGGAFINAVYEMGLKSTIPDVEGVKNNNVSLNFGWKF